MRKVTNQSSVGVERKSRLPPFPLPTLPFNSRAASMGDLYPSHYCSRNTSNEDIPSTTIWEPDPSSESEHLVLLHISS